MSYFKFKSHEFQGNIETSSRLKETKKTQQPMQQWLWATFLVNNDIIKLKCFDVLRGQNALGEYRYPHIP